MNEDLGIIFWAFCLEQEDSSSTTWMGRSVGRLVVEIQSEQGHLHAGPCDTFRIMAKIPDLSAAGTAGHALTTSAKSGDSLVKSAKKRDSFSSSDS